MRGHVQYPLYVYIHTDRYYGLIIDPLNDHLLVNLIAQLVVYRALHQHHRGQGLNPHSGLSHYTT